MNQHTTHWPPPGHVMVPHPGPAADCDIPACHDAGRPDDARDGATGLWATTGEDT